MVYSDYMIRQAIANSHIVAWPIRSEAIRGSSVDVTLGEYYFQTDRADNLSGYNPFDREDVARYFGAPLQALSHHIWSVYHKGLHWEGIPPEHPMIVIPAHGRILAHTHEFIGIHAPGTTEMRARSTWGRNGIVVCKDAGWGDPGYINRWTMEIQNDNDEMVALPVGERIAQIIFHETGPVESRYDADGKYQVGKTLVEVVAGWKPQAMLPRAYKDSRKPLLPDDVVAARDFTQEPPITDTDQR